MISFFDCFWSAKLKTSVGSTTAARSVPRPRSSMSMIRSMSDRQTTQKCSLPRSSLFSRSRICRMIL